MKALSSKLKAHVCVVKALASILKAHGSVVKALASILKAHGSVVKALASILKAHGSVVKASFETGRKHPGNRAKAFRELGEYPQGSGRKHSEKWAKKRRPNWEAKCKMKIDWLLELMGPLK